MIKLKNLIKESYVSGKPDNDYYDIYNEVQQEFRSGQKYQTWRLIPAKDLLLLWATFSKYGRVDEDKLDKIWEIVKENVLKIVINSEVWHGSDPEFFGVESYDDIPEEENNRHSLFISDRSGNKYVRSWNEVEGNARYSDAYQYLYKLFEKCYSASTAEELLIGIDGVLNFVHGLGAMAKWFVQGGTATLDKIRDFQAKGIHLTGRLTEILSFKKSKNLLPLIKLASYYSTFRDFESDYINKNFHGLYWHLTADPNFKINPQQSPTDLSSLSSGHNKEPGLMVTTDIENWESTFEKTRPYVALIDLSDLKPNADYRYVGRGFGHEIYVLKPEKAKVIKVVPIQKAKQLNNYFYKNTLPKSSEELEAIYNLAHKNNLTETFFKSFETPIRGQQIYVEVFYNPSEREVKEITSNDQYAVLLTNRGCYAWNRDKAYHQTIRQFIGKDAKNALPLLVFVEGGNKISVMVTDNSKNTTWNQNPKTRNFIENHPYFKFKQVIEVLYYDEDIVGSWDELTPNVNEEIESTGYLYHVTPKKNLRRISVAGITPSVPKDEQDERAVYLFKNKVEAEDALMNWLGDRFPEDEPLVMMTIKSAGLNIVPGTAGFEVMSYNTIPWKNIVKVENV